MGEGERVVRYPATRFLQSPVGRVIDWALYRWGPYERLTGRLVWAEIERGWDGEAIRRIEADMAAGRWYSYDSATGISTPNPDWPKDGEQPR
jgi:hypothetical protein